MRWVSRGPRSYPQTFRARELIGCLAFSRPRTRLAASVQTIEAHGTAGQDAMLSSRRCAFKAFAHHVGRAGEKPIRMRIVGRPHDLVGADEVRKYLEAGFDRLERNPAIALEQ